MDRFSDAGVSEPVWQETGPGMNVEQLQIVSWTVIVILAGAGALACLILLACVCYCVKTSGKKKKRHAFGIRKAYFKDKIPTVRPRNPAPVSNPDKGSHYLKKSPSPTGVKSPPGALDFLSKKSIITYGQQVVYSEHNENGVDGLALPQGDEGLRRSSSGSIANGGGSGLDDENQTLGVLHCTMKYCFDKNALIVTVNKCENLPAKDTAAKSSDPYVKLQLLPEKQHKVKTRVMRRTLNPVYDEDFTFYGIHFSQLQSLTLHFVVLSFDRYSRDDVIGEVMVELEKVDLSTSQEVPVPLAREITPRSFKLKSQGRGEVLISLCYQPAANRMTVVVLKARNLPKMDITGLSDPYVKIYLLFHDQRISKKKTHVKKRTLNPVFNESFVFDLPHLGDDGLSHVSLEFMMLDWDRVTKNEVIGRLELGGDKCTGTALHHWNEVLSSPRRQIAEWHKLKE